MKQNKCIHYSNYLGLCRDTGGCTYCQNRECTKNGNIIQNDFEIKRKLESRKTYKKNKFDTIRYIV